MKWYYAQNNQRQGPVSENEFDFLVHQKKILPDTMVWNETMPGWRPLREVLPEEPPPLPQPDVWSIPRPAAALPAVIERDGPAWEERDSIGGLKAVAMTVRELLLSPHIAFSRMKTVSDWLGPFCFALFVVMLGNYANMGYNTILCRLSPGIIKGYALLYTSDSAMLFLVIFFYFFIPLLVFLVVPISVLIHIALILVGGVRQPFQATYRVVCYSLGASAALQFIPLVGILLAMVWNLSLMIHGIAKMHEISIGKAALAIMPVVFCTVYFFMYCLGRA